MIIQKNSNADKKTSIREIAAKWDFEIVGKLVRRADLEHSSHERIYLDEANNEYVLWNGILTIYTADGGIL